MKGGAILAAEANGSQGEGHAEERALRPHRNFEGATLYVIRLDGKKVSRPCYHCTRLILKSNISHVVFFDGDDWVKLTPEELYDIVPPYTPPVPSFAVKYTYVRG